MKPGVLFFIIKNILLTYVRYRVILHIEKSSYTILLIQSDGDT